ncbi:hypothetical protein CIRG_10223 [Coccidioides immitis RMSCC 2394]|uniref:Uncharacterized protein n=1 Tax=Coccidioides immitis RMSCC 2394 TaxID=404692 RepID=A0A0J6Y3T9_COCIT|nr:hypothetical protein CIRG_10223 [Coccidioides immitis RMSCC 2394]
MGFPVTHPRNAQVNLRARRNLALDRVHGSHAPLDPAKSRDDDDYQERDKGRLKFTKRHFTSLGHWMCYATHRSFLKFDVQWLESGLGLMITESLLDSLTTPKRNEDC